MTCFGQCHRGGLGQSYRLKLLPHVCQPNDLITTLPLVNPGKPILPSRFEGFHWMNTEGTKLVLIEPSNPACTEGETTLEPSAASTDLPTFAATAEAEAAHHEESRMSMQAAAHSSFSKAACSFPNNPPFPPGMHISITAGCCQTAHCSRSEEGHNVVSPPCYH